MGRSGKYQRFRQWEASVCDKKSQRDGLNRDNLSLSTALVGGEDHACGLWWDKR